MLRSQTLRVLAEIDLARAVGRLDSGNVRCPSRVLRPATGASPEEAHEIEDALFDQLAALAVMAKRQTHRRTWRVGDRSADLTGLAVEMVRLLKRNPGCAQSGTREWYADCFRQFVLELRWRHADVTTAEFAAAIDLPLDTVEDWLCGGHRGVHATARATYPRTTRGARARLA